MADDDVSVLRRRLAEAQAGSAQVAELRDQLASGEAELARIAVLEDALQHERRRAEIAEADRARLERELAEAGDLRGRLERSEQLLRDLQASPSWRITRPLRGAKRLLG
jgi:chromosome segregation ATPase